MMNALFTALLVFGLVVLMGGAAVGLAVLLGLLAPEDERRG